jgi:hypothetical protein
MMPYTAEISRLNPSCFLFLIDQSGSMQDVMDPTNVQAMDRPTVVDGRTYTHAAAGRTKAQGVADAINRLLQNLVIKCAKAEGVRNFYDVGVLGYGGASSGSEVGPAFSGSIAGRELVPISEIANYPARIEERPKKVDDGAGGLIDQKIKFPIWFDPVANGGTPMSQAMTKAKAILTDWVSRHPASFPPIVINITDGEWSDADPTPAADSIKGLATNDGSVLLFNIHISSNQSASVEFPDDESRLGDQYAKFLFRLSSFLPSYMQAIARQEGLPVSEMSRGFAFNADMVGLIRFIDIGTRPGNLR